MSASVAILVTGGTFDKEYDELTGRLFFRDTHVEDMLRRGRSRIDVSVEIVMMIDSLDMTAEDRARIVERCRARAEHAIVISHGLFNLGSALSFAQVLPPGIYVAMNGQHFAWDEVRKNRAHGVFERTP